MNGLKGRFALVGRNHRICAEVRATLERLVDERRKIADLQKLAMIRRETWRSATAAPWPSVRSSKP
jgi:hypothetical protein